MVTLSSSEAEYVTLSLAMTEVTAIFNFLNECEVCDVQEPALIYEDNEAVIKMATSSWTTPRSRHISIRYHHIRELLNSSRFEIKYVRTSAQLADALTKAVARETLLRLVRFVFGL